MQSHQPDPSAEARTRSVRIRSSNDIVTHCFDTPYDRELLLDYLTRQTQRVGELRLKLDRQTWTIVFRSPAATCTTCHQSCSILGYGPPLRRSPSCLTCLFESLAAPVAVSAVGANAASKDHDHPLSSLPSRKGSR